MNESEIEDLCRDHGYLIKDTGLSLWWHIQPDPTRDYTPLPVLWSLLHLADATIYPSHAHSLEHLFIRRTP